MTNAVKEAAKAALSAGTAAGIGAIASAGTGIVAAAPYVALAASAVALGHIASKHAKTYDYNSYSTTFGTITTGSATNPYNPDIIGDRFGFDPFSNKMQRLAKLAMAALTSSVSKTLTKTITNKYNNRKTQSVYLLYDRETRQIEYVGRTENLDDREKAHKRSANRKH